MNAAENAAIQRALAAADINAPIESQRGLSGGCIHRVLQVTLSDGRQLAAKINAASALPLFNEEREGLQALAATKSVIVPRVLACLAHEGTAVLLMTMIQPPSRFDIALAAQTFGRQLARLHEHDVGNRYGFARDNHIGSTPQINTWCDDWVEFNAPYRLGYQAERAAEQGLLRDDEVATVQRVIDRLDSILPRRPKPVLLHGDLWSGNAIPALADDGGPTFAVIDPACSIGDGLADIAMMQLFGGFSQGCFNAYAIEREISLDSPEAQRALAVYQLYHVLNHVNIFGRGYAAQAMSLARGLA